MKVLFRTAVLAVVGTTVLQGVCGARVLAKTNVDAAPLCQRLADVAREIPVKAWSQRDPTQGLAPFLLIDKANSSPPPFEAALAQRPDVKLALENEADYFGEVTDHLADTDLYAISTFGGSANCQSLVFLRARADNDPTIIDPPSFNGGGEYGSGNLCWTLSGALGSAFGQPVFVEHGTVSDHHFDAEVTLHPWTGAGWGRACTVSLTFRTGYLKAEQHCLDRDVCRAGQRIALKVAKAYAAYRGTPNAPNTFTFESNAPETALLAAQRASDTSPTFPYDKEEALDGYHQGFSNSGSALFPLQLSGRWWVAAVGHAGVGWRESNTTLLAIYDERNGQLEPMAGFVIEAVNQGLVEARAEPAPTQDNR